MKAIEKEMRQLHDRDVMPPVHKHCLMPEQRKEVLAYLMFLKRKPCGKIKGRGCADSRKQRAYITKEESKAPMVSTEAVFLTGVIDVLETEMSQSLMSQVHLCKQRLMSWCMCGSQVQW